MCALSDVAGALAEEICVSAERCTIEVGDFCLEKRLVDVDLLKPVGICREFLFAFLHMADRLAFAAFGEEKRNEFMSMLGGRTLSFHLETLLSEEVEIEERDSMFQALIALFNQRSSEYAQCEKFAPAPGESPEGTFVWEIGSLLSRTVIGEEENEALIKLGASLAAYSLKQIDIKGKLKQI